MNPILLYAIIATVVMILAHVALFWWFLVRRERTRSGRDGRLEKEQTD